MLNPEVFPTESDPMGRLVLPVTTRLVGCPTATSSDEHHLRIFWRKWNKMMEAV